MAVDQEQLIRGLLQLAENLSSGLPLEVRLTDLCRTTVRLLGCDRSSIFLREGRVMELKDEVNELLAKLGQPPRYENPGVSHEDHSPAPDGILRPGLG